MKRLIGLCALSLCVLTSVNSYATPLDAATNQALSEYLTHQNKYGRFSGNVIIAQENQILFEQAVGYADVQMQRPIEKNNLFKVGDITKQLTAAAILKLNEQKKLAIDTPISRYFPNLSRSKQITIGMLMNHTAGIGRDFNWNDATQSCSRNSLINPIISSSKTYPPALMFNYSNNGYYLLGRIIEKASGLPYHEYITEQFLRPLGMKDSSMKLTLSFQLAKSYELSGLLNAHITPTGCAWSAGELISTSRDLLVWSRALASGQVISQESLDKMYQHQYGLFAKEIGQTDFYTHSGHIDGFKSILMYEPKSQMTIVALSNFSNTNTELFSIDLVRLLNKQLPIHKVMPPIKHLAPWQDDVDVIGNYMDSLGVPLQVVYQDGELVAKVSQFRIPLMVQNRNTLFAQGIDNKIRIHRNDNETTKEIVFFAKDGRYLSRFTRVN
ncbi:serine hydrolase domain-containing protein [Photobacterium damselae]|uniref:serine hydrolase domain-containing protein n=1 Tax=Photobacterium damselae TaxID=38293 RepID=UPI00370B51B3